MTLSQRRELLELWLLGGDGVATQLQLDRLNQILETDSTARQYILTIARHQAWLAWHSSEARLPEVAAAISSLIGNDLEPAPSAAGCARTIQVEHHRTRMHRSLSWSTVAAAAAFVGMLVGHWTGRFYRDSPEPAVQATMVSATGCVWGPGSSLLASKRNLAGGDGLELMEGIAEFRIGLGSSDVRLQLEGPASVVLTAHGSISLRYGKIIVTAGAITERYAIETSFGRVLIEPHAQLGLVSFGSTEEVHSFRGEALVESPWLDASADRSVIKSGEALYLKEQRQGVLESMRGKVQHIRFALQSPMTDDFLNVGADYVKEITDSRPIAYWRFEGDRDGVVQNEISDRFHGRLKGKVRWFGPAGNQAIEFGVTPEPGSMVVAESWGELLEHDFSLEAWIKPSHYHLGSILGFIGDFDWQDRRNKHGLLLEVNGTSPPSNINQPQRIRFLHRAQLSVTGGVSLYSDAPYQVRRWQYVCGVRDGDELLLYLNGQLVKRQPVVERLPRGLQLVVGQLYTESIERFFIGHMDEMAVYDHPLSSDDVQRHYELLRPAAEPSGHVL